MGSAMGSHRFDAGHDLGSGASSPAHRSAELRRRNRRLGLGAALVALLLVIGTICYVTWVGGANMFPSGRLGAASGIGGGTG